MLNDANFKEKISEGVVLVDFFADWCAPCKMVAPIIENLSKEVTNAKIYKVNVEECPNVSNEYGIRSIPTFILFKDGEVAEKIMGAQPRAEFYLGLINKHQ